MRKQSLGLRNPEEIPLAGTTLRALMSEKITVAQARSELQNSGDPGDLLRNEDEVWRFRTPAWTWSTMSGVEGIVVLRDGLAAHWLVTRMN
ncbi:hypothetical protein Pan241w_50230 [Gimesia alba]|uniref:Uncharacterized protein n=1 Tax=Gimesia alba TaxID=2527973 RepID=A0A517RM09_9PLAN|nr:hypothetical protein [Gimesia alba]QDT44907.1 hypothetical protein Pan241w_50230 [Gimesia alba]